MTEDEYRHTFVPLRDYIEARLDAIDEAMREARRVMEHRMNGVPQEYVKKGDLNECVVALSLKVDMLMEFKNQMQGMASQSELSQVRRMAMISMTVGIGGLMVGIGGLIVHLLMSK